MNPFKSAPASAPEIVHVLKSIDQMSEIDKDTLLHAALVDKKPSQDFVALPVNESGKFRVPLVLEMADEKDLILAREGLNNGVDQEWDIAVEKKQAQAEDSQRGHKVSRRAGVVLGVTGLVCMAGVPASQFAEKKMKRDDIIGDEAGMVFAMGAFAMVAGIVAYHYAQKGMKAFRDTMAEIAVQKEFNKIRRAEAHAEIANRLSALELKCN